MSKLGDNPHLHVGIDPKIHYTMKVQAAKEQKTLRQFIEMVIVRYMESIVDRGEE